MSETSERYEGNFMEGIDIAEGKSYTLEIASVTAPGSEKDARRQVIKDAIITFAKAKKRFILNKTNWKVIVAVLGKDDSAWPGHKITVMRRYLKEFMGHKNVPCIRVIPPKGTSIPMSAHTWMGQATPYGSDRGTDVVRDTSTQDDAEFAEAAAADQEQPE